MRVARCVLAGLLVAGISACNRAHTAAAAGPAVASGEIRSVMPDFDVRDLHGHEISSKSLAGKVVLIDIWATWCQPCRKEMPGYQQLLDRYGKQGLVVIGLKSNMMMDTEEPLKFAKEIGVRYPLVSASTELVSKFGELRGLPTTMIYDRSGLLRAKVIGFEYVQNFEKALTPLLPH